MNKIYGLLFLLIFTPAKAAVTITYSEVGADVVATLSGNFNLDAVVSAGSASAGARERSLGTCPYQDHLHLQMLLDYWAMRTGPRLL